MWTPRAEIRDFLTSRRARITPQQAGLPEAGRRRVPGLRRSELAHLAGISIEYLTQLERGNTGSLLVTRIEPCSWRQATSWEEEKQVGSVLQVARLQR